MQQNEQWGAAISTDEDLLTCPWLSSYSVAQFLTSHGLVLVHGPETGGPWSKRFCQKPLFKWVIEK